ncbi:MFS transporter [Siculibacillus lacustris]|uniref:MFS transporter n=1 Tax=Siculibacillus lacustris TaxID=1549641 RepID=A0A4Q9VTN4_9HYPH|nr:MFS transporter [Siculibacillus lacustris]
MPQSALALPVDPIARARWAVSAMFFVNGAGVGSWAPYIPLVQTRLGLSAADLGLALLAAGVGALIAMPFAGRLAARHGSGAVTRLAAVAVLASFLLPVLAPTATVLAIGLFLFGAGNGLMDVAMNAHGVLVERRLGRPIMSSLHACWSLGGLSGAGLGGLALAGMAPPLHAVAVVVVLGGIAALAASALLGPEDRAAAAGPAFALPGRRTLGIGLLTFASFVAEGAMLDWTGVYLAGSLGTTAAFAASGYAAFSAAMTLGRLTGDRVRAAVGALVMVRAGGVVAAVGLGLGLAVGTPWAAVAGFTLAGLGLSNLVPVFFGAGGRAEEGSGHGIAAVATMGYFGFLIGPPAIGGLAEILGLPLALGLVAAGVGLVGVFAGLVRDADA